MPTLLSLKKAMKKHLPIIFLKKAYPNKSKESAIQIQQSLDLARYTTCNARIGEEYR